MILTSLLLGAALQTKTTPDKSVRAKAGLPRQRAYATEKAREAGLPDLRTAKIGRDDLELRVWSGFSWNRLEGFVLRRTKGQWRGDRVILPMRGKNPTGKARLVRLSTAIGGWPALWRELDGLGVRTLPNEATLPDDGIRIMDAGKYLFEIRTGAGLKGAGYHAYLYDAPRAHPDRAQSRTVLEMIQVITTAVPKLEL